MKVRLTVFAAFAALFGMAHADAADISIIGRWEIAEATPAPWSQPADRPALVAEGKSMLGLAIVFEPKSISSKHKMFTCKRSVIYTANRLEADTLFQGNLPEPNPVAVAVRLGFPRTDVPGVDVRCLKAQYTFHFRDPNTAMININRVIYTLKRK